MPPRPYAGLVTRAIGLIVDAVVINVIALMTGGVIALIGSLLRVGKPGVIAVLTTGFVWFAWTAVYFIAFWMVTGQTPGARLLGIRVVPDGPHRLGIVRAVLRFAVMMLALIPLGAGFVTVLFDDRRRGPHDMVASTVARWAATDAAPDLATAVAAATAAATAPARATAAAAAPAWATAAGTADGTASGVPLAPGAPPVADAPPAPGTGPAPAAGPAAAAPLSTPPPAPLVGEVVGPAPDDQADGRGAHAARDRPRITPDQLPPTRFETRPGA